MLILTFCLELNLCPLLLIRIRSLSHLFFPAAPKRYRNRVVSSHWLNDIFVPADLSITGRTIRSPL